MHEEQVVNLPGVRIVRGKELQVVKVKIVTLSVGEDKCKACACVSRQLIQGNEFPQPVTLPGRCP